MLNGEKASAGALCRSILALGIFAISRVPRAFDGTLPPEQT